ncbi:hypothetical protein U1Q18_034354, partial [Sarracenia purpurea var. burkii]
YAEGVKRTRDINLVDDLTVWKVVSFARALGLDNIHVEGTRNLFNRGIVKGTRNLQTLSSSPTCLHVKRTLQTLSSSPTCLHVKRTGNAVGHALAKLALSLNVSRTWMGDVHPTTRQLVEADRKET